MLTLLKFISFFPDPTKSLKAIGLPVTAFFNNEGKLSTIHQGPISEETLDKSIMELLDV